jgi:hypothetical protein
MARAVSIPISSQAVRLVNSHGGKSVKIAGLVVEKKDDKWQIRAWGPLPKADEKTNQRRIHLTLVVLAIAVLGLVLMLVSQNAPEWEKLLQKLISSAL